MASVLPAFEKAPLIDAPTDAPRTMPIMTMLLQQQAAIDMSMTLNKMIMQQMQEARDFDVVGVWHYSQGCYEIVSKDGEYLFREQANGAEAALIQQGEWLEGCTNLGSIRLRVIEGGRLLSHFKAHNRSEWGEPLIATRKACPSPQTRPAQSWQTPQQRFTPVSLETITSTEVQRSSDDITTPLMGKRDKRKLSIQQGEARIEFMFPKVDDLQDAVERARDKHMYKVEDKYSKVGFAQALARNEIFKNFAMFIIILNAFWIGFEVDLDETTPLSQNVDSAFCAFFLFEICVRFAAFEKKHDGQHDRWFVFDSILCFLMVWDTWGSSLVDDSSSSSSYSLSNAGMLRTFRLVRIFKVARTSRLLTSFPELLVLAAGMVKGVRSVIAVLWILLFILYVFGVVFTMTLRDTEVGSGVFDTVLRSMNSLLMQVLCGPDSDFMQSILNAGIEYYVVFLLFVLFANLTTMNMLIGILCDVVSNNAQESKDEVFATEVRKQIDLLAETLDADNDGTISKEEFDYFIHDPKVVSKCEELSVDMVGVAAFGRFVFRQVDTMDYAAFTDLVSQFRGGKPSTQADIANLRKYLALELVNLENRLTKHVQA